MQKPQPELLEKVIVNCVPRSVRLRVEIIQSPRKASTSGPSPGLRETQEYAATSSGQRFLDELLVFEDQGTRHRTYYCDSRRCARVSYAESDPYKQSSVLVNNVFGNEERYGFMEAPPPIRYYQVGLVPIHEALLTAERMGESQVIGRICDVFHFKSVGPPRFPQSLVYCLDRATAVPLRVGAYSDPERIRAEIPNWIWEAKSLDSVGGRHLVLSSTLSVYRLFKSDDGKLENKLDIFQTIRVTRAEFDVDLPRSTFWPAYQPGVEVIDTISHRTYTVPGGPVDGKVVGVTGEPIQVPRPESNYLVFTGVGVTLSIAIFAVALVLWRRKT